VLMSPPDSPVANSVLRRLYIVRPTDVGAWRHTIPRMTGTAVTSLTQRRCDGRAGRTCKTGAPVAAPIRRMRAVPRRKEATPVVALSAALLALGVACHLDALLGPPGGGGSGGGGAGGGGGGGGSGLASVAQLRSDMTTPIPTGGSTPGPPTVV